MYLHGLFFLCGFAFVGLICSVGGDEFATG
jgi:hypothetical protein